MRIEVPVLQRCCFCLPLRRGLLTWGYIKMIISSIALVYAYYLYIVVDHYFHNIELYSIVIAWMCLLVTEIIVHGLLVFGAHKKYVKCIKVYYYYSLTLLVVTLLLAVTIAGLIFTYVIDDYYDTYNARRIFVYWSTTMFANLVAQSYVILLVRSEIIKHNNVGAFRFVNNAAEAECELQIENPVEDTAISTTDKEIDDRIVTDSEIE